MEVNNLAPTASPSADLQNSEAPFPTQETLQGTNATAQQNDETAATPPSVLERNTSAESDTIEPKLDPDAIEELKPPLVPEVVEREESYSESEADSDREQGTPSRKFRSGRRSKVGRWIVRMCRCRSNSCFSDIFSGIGIGGLIVGGIAIALAPLVLYALYLYYFNYATIYPGSKVAYDVYKNQSTGTAFGFFYWFTATLVATYLVVLLSACSENMDDNNCAQWPLGLLILFCLSLPYWLRFPIFNHTYNNVWQNQCNDWDIRAVLSGLDYSDYVWTLPSQIVNITLTMAKTDVNFTINRRPLSPLVYDMILQSNAAEFYSNITYDVGNLQILADGLNANYIIDPNLNFPTLGLSLADPSIPWIRPDYYTCWPTSVNIVHDHIGVLQTVTLNPNDCTQMLVCGTASSELSNFQIVLGLTAVSQFQYGVCCTSGSNQVSFAGEAPEG